MKTNTKHFIRAAALVVSMGFFTMLPNCAKSQTNKTQQYKTNNQTSRDNFNEFKNITDTVIENFRNQNNQKLSHIISDKSTIKNQTENVERFLKDLKSSYFLTYNKIAELATEYKISPECLSSVFDKIQDTYYGILFSADSVINPNPVRMRAEDYKMKHK